MAVLVTQNDSFEKFIHAVLSQRHGAQIPAYQKDTGTLSTAAALSLCLLAAALSLCLLAAAISLCLMLIRSIRLCATCFGIATVGK